MRTLVTGASGFVGYEVVRSLQAQGDEVWAVSRRTPAPPDFEKLHGVSVVTADFSTAEGRDFLADVRPDVCVHCAWYVEPGKYLSSMVNIDMMASTLKLAEALSRGGCRRFVGVGTCFEYELSAASLGEGSPVAPAHVYSSSKLATYLVLRELSRVLGLSMAWARLFYLYGPREDARRLVPSVITSILRGLPAELSAGTQVRDFLHVADAAAGIVALAKSDVRGAVNVCSEQAVRVAEIAATVADLLDRHDLLRLGARPQAPGDPPVVLGSNSLLRTSTSWLPRYDLRSGLSATIDWWKHELVG